MIVTLLTDFGDTDAYVAAMKGVILSRNGAIRIVDISHRVPPQRVATATYLLLTSFADFPPGAVHTVVVDPGVGSARRALACRAGGHVFVAPDNGVLGPVLERAGGAEAREIVSPELLRARGSHTFHGRDVFAPTAAALADGFRFEEVGPQVDDWNPGTSLFAVGSERGVDARVLHIDHFGNLILNVRAADLPGDLHDHHLLCGGQVIREWRNYFAEGDGEGPFLYTGSSGFVEVAVNRGSAAAALGARLDDPVRLVR